MVNEFLAMKCRVMVLASVTISWTHRSLLSTLSLAIKYHYLLQHFCYTFQCRLCRLEPSSAGLPNENLIPIDLPPIVRRFANHGLLPHVRLVNYGRDLNVTMD